MRAAISWTTISAIVVGISVHSSPYPNFAPACQYVRIPPGSLSTLAVMKPGPSTARKANSRNRLRMASPFSAKGTRKSGRE
jgi:hypothetical protein